MIQRQAAGHALITSSHMHRHPHPLKGRRATLRIDLGQYQHMISGRQASQAPPGRLLQHPWHRAKTHGKANSAEISPGEKNPSKEIAVAGERFYGVRSEKAHSQKDRKEDVVSEGISGFSKVPSGAPLGRWPTRDRWPAEQVPIEGTGTTSSRSDVRNARFETPSNG